MQAPGSVQAQAALLGGCEQKEPAQATTAVRYRWRVGSSGCKMRSAGLFVGYFLPTPKQEALENSGPVTFLESCHSSQGIWCLYETPCPCESQEESDPATGSLIAPDPSSQILSYCCEPHLRTNLLPSPSRALLPGSLGSSQPFSTAGISPDLPEHNDFCPWVSPGELHPHWQRGPGPSTPPISVQPTHVHTRTQEGLKEQMQCCRHSVRQRGICLRQGDVGGVSVGGGNATAQALQRQTTTQETKPLGSTDLSGASACLSTCLPAALEVPFTWASALAARE